MTPLLSPVNGRLLRPDGPHALSDGERLWPVVEGIPYLRVGRDALRMQALAALDAGDNRAALAALLADQDDFASTPPATGPALADLIEKADAGEITLRDAMDRLAFGPVGIYFAHRWSVPTFLSALGLLDRHWTNPPLLIEIACGIGQILRETTRTGVPAIGVDVVFAKLWLARRFVVPQAQLVCADADAGLPLASLPGATVLCHDAFYFLRDKAFVLAEMRRVAGKGGTVLIGHAHNARFDHGAVAGTPLASEDYAALAPDALLYDDADLAAGTLDASVEAKPRRSKELADIEAVSLAIGPVTARRSGFPVLPKGTPLRLNPLLKPDGAGRLAPDWPDPRFAREYAGATYLAGEAPDPATIERAASGLRDAAIDRLARRRVLLDLPPQW